MKKTMRWLAVLFSALLLTATACGGTPDSGKTDGTGNGTEETDLKQYDVTTFELEKYIAPIWDGTVCYAEAAFVRENEAGTVEPIRLLYDIEKIVSVRSADLKTLYTEGVDYTVSDGKLHVVRDGNIPVLPYDRYYFDTYTDDGLQTQIPSATETGAYIVAEMSLTSAGMSAWCLAVTYTHKAATVIQTPDDRQQTFAAFNGKLAAREDVRVAYYGDSITYGWSSTALPEINRDPHCPSYCDLAMDAVEAAYGVTVERRNFSVSGQTSEWATAYVNYSPIVDYAPDLVVLAFGMNDGVGIEPRTFRKNIRSIVENLQERIPHVEIAVVLPMLPNAQVGYSQGTTLRKYQPAYPAAFAADREEWEENGVALVDVTAVHQAMLTRKVFQDTTSSNTNHPNDYMHRVYAQTLLRTLVGR